MIITDNGRQFTDKVLRRTRHHTRDKLDEHTQPNGQVEFANKIIQNEFKKRLGLAKGKWTKELVEVIWATQQMA